MNPLNNLQATVPQTSDEIDIPSEDNTLSQDNRLSSHQLASRPVREHDTMFRSTTQDLEGAGYGPSSTLSYEQHTLERPVGSGASDFRYATTETIPGGTNFVFSETAPVKAKDEREIERHLAVGAGAEETHVLTSFPEHPHGPVQTYKYVSGVTEEDVRDVQDNLPAERRIEQTNFQSSYPISTNQTLYQPPIITQTGPIVSQGERLIDQQYIASNAQYLQAQPLTTTVGSTDPRFIQSSIPVVTHQLPQTQILGTQTIPVTSGGDQVIRDSTSIPLISQGERVINQHHLDSNVQYLQAQPQPLSTTVESTDSRFIQSSIPVVTHQLPQTQILGTQTIPITSGGDQVIRDSTPIPLISQGERVIGQHYFDSNVQYLQAQPQPLSTTVESTDSRFIQSSIPVVTHQLPQTQILGSETVPVISGGDQVIREPISSNIENLQPQPQPHIAIQTTETIESRPIESVPITSTQIQGQPLIQETAYISPAEQVIGQNLRPGVELQSQPLPVIGTEVIEQRLVESENVEFDSQHLRDSGKLERVSGDPSDKAQWDAQQQELTSMRYNNHQTFENWEANRNVFVNDRLNIMNDLLGGLDKTLNWLDIGMDKVILFFKEREAQEVAYSKTVSHGLTQVGAHFDQSSNPDIMQNFSRGLKENDAFHAVNKKNSEVLGMFIKKDILDWCLLPTEKNYKAQAITLRTPLLTHKKRMDSLANKRSRAYNKYFKAYDSFLKSGKSSGDDQNLFKRQLKYSLSAREELRMLRLYNEQGLLLINEFTKLSMLRLGEVQKAFSLYLQKYTELYQGVAETPEPVLELIERSKGPLAVQQLFSVKNLLSFNNYVFLQKVLGKPGELTYPDLDPFLVNFPESVDPSRSSFVLKEWEAIKQGGILKKPRPCNVIATANNNLLIVEKKDENKELGKIKDPMQLRYTKVEEVNATEDGTVLKVVERAPGTLFTHKTRANLKFGTQEEAQQFIEYVNNQPSGEA